MLNCLDIAETLEDPARRAEYLGFVFVGAGYAGVEGCAELQDYVSSVIDRYPRCRMHGTRWVLVEAQPKIMHTQSAAEYWHRSGSLVHTSPIGQQDAVIPANVRIYAFGGSMGGQETLLLLARHPHLLAGAAAFDSVTNMALQYRSFLRIPCNRNCLHTWHGPLGKTLQSLVTLLRTAPDRPDCEIAGFYAFDGLYQEPRSDLEKSLDIEIEQPDADPARVARARAERDWLVAQLSSAAGFAGRTRAFPDQPERARVAVGKAIRAAAGPLGPRDATPHIG